MSKWTVIEDNYECNKGMPYTAVLKLSGYKDNELTCNDGQRVKMAERCDKIIHCRNQSDKTKMEIVFKTRLTNELLTTYLPSLLLLGITYATTYFT